MITIRAPVGANNNAIAVDYEFWLEMYLWQPGNGETNATNTNATAGPTETAESYKKKNGLEYPVNVARWGNSSSCRNYQSKTFCVRNVARQTVSTHFVFPSDIELYPRWKWADAVSGQFLLLFDYFTWHDALVHKIMFQPKPHLGISGYDPQGWARSTYNKV